MMTQDEANAIVSEIFSTAGYFGYPLVDDGGSLTDGHYSEPARLDSRLELRAQCSDWIASDAEVAVWHTPPECKGQPVEYAYGTDPEGNAWERAIDSADGAQALRLARYRMLGTAGKTWDPSSRAPSLSAGDYVP